MSVIETRVKTQRNGDKIGTIKVNIEGKLYTVHFDYIDKVLSQWGAPSHILTLTWHKAESLVQTND